MILNDFNSIGGPLKDALDDLHYMDTKVLAQYRYHPAYGQAATAELGRRARIQAEDEAQKNPDPSNKPTVMEQLLYSLTTGKPLREEAPANQGGIASFSATPIPAPIPAPAPAPAAAPAPAPAPMAMAGPPVRRAQGGIVALNGEGGSYLKRQYPKETSERNILADLFSGVGPTIEDFIQGLKGFKSYEARRAEAGDESKAQPVSSALSYPESGTPQPISTVSKFVPSSKPPSPRPTVAPTPAVPAALEASAPTTPAEPDYLAKAMQVLGAPPTDPTRLADAARARAMAERSAITDPSNQRIKQLLAETAGIGASRDAGAMGRALTQFGLNLAGKSARPGSATAALSEAGLGALASYEKEQLGMIDRALRVNQTKIELEKELMKQGLDRNTAGILAEKEARDRVYKEDKEQADKAKDMGTLAVQNKQAIAAQERARNALEVAQIRLDEAMARRGSQDEVQRLRMQVMLAEIALKQQAATTLSPKDLLEIEKSIGENWGSVNKEFYAQLPEGKKIVADLSAGRIKESDLPPEIRNAAKNLYRQSFVAGTSRANVFAPSNTDVLKTLRGG